jgi:hypothetical protein
MVYDALSALGNPKRFGTEAAVRKHADDVELRRSAAIPRS